MKRPPLMPILRWMRQTDNFDPFRVERFLPRENVLIDAVDQRAVEIEQEHRLYAHLRNLPLRPRAEAASDPIERARSTRTSE